MDVCVAHIHTTITLLIRIWINQYKIFSTVVMYYMLREYMKKGCDRMALAYDQKFATQYSNGDSTYI